MQSANICVCLNVNILHRIICIVQTTITDIIKHIYIICDIIYNFDAYQSGNTFIIIYNFYIITLYILPFKHILVEFPLLSYLSLKINVQILLKQI